jgi:RsiW-degrading membrane proteinase PrsW (M82 family)
MTQPDAPPPAAGAPAPAAEPRQASLIQVAGAVFWSFVGVRKGKHMQQDAVTVKPLQVVIIGVLLAAVIVFALLALVRFIMRNAA